jgi:hypothetical protein
MWQDGPTSSYIHTAGTSGSSSSYIGAMSGMRALKGPVWTQYGGLRQNNPAGTTPTRVGVGPFTASYSYYQDPSVPSQINLLTFSACAVFVPSGSTSTQVLGNNHQNPPVGGWQLVVVEVGNVSLFGYTSGVGSGTVAQAIAWTTGIPNLVCWGFDSVADTCSLRQNKGTVASSGACRTSLDSGAFARIGTHHDLLVPFNGTLVEYWVSREAPSLIVFNRVAAEVEARGGITLP